VGLNCTSNNKNNNKKIENSEIFSFFKFCMKRNWILMKIKSWLVIKTNVTLLDDKCNMFDKFSSP